MLQLKDIHKRYKTGDLVQNALDGVSLNLRDNEFVAILGPSGSGKTTLLNIIGGLDVYDEGDLIINNISTKKYNDRDWDSYRNHTIGFVFQNYNLIPHQSLLANVELALTISGVNPAERRKKAKEALKKVGLETQIHKKPNQLSGGQMQRVAIARALVNDPDILLADEPTGALDSETSIQVMELLKEVARDKLVVMVTHNSELAEEYASRIVSIKDGKIVGDTMPCDDPAAADAPKHKNLGKASMSAFTALSLSFSNLRTKKGRTLLTAFAGSIGIIGIALILSLSNGINNYIVDIQKSTMSSYPITIDATTIDLSNIMSGTSGAERLRECDHELDGVYSNVLGFELASAMSTSFTENNLSAFKKYLDNKNSEIYEYIGENGVIYSYNPKFSVYTHDPDGELVNTDGSTLSGGKSAASNYSSMASMSSMSMLNNLTELLPDADGKGISQAVTDKYELVWGEWCENYDEIVLIVDKNNEIMASRLFQIGMLSISDYKDIVSEIMAGEDITLESTNWSFEEIASKEYCLIPACDLYIEQDDGLYKKMSSAQEIETLLTDSLKLKVTGIIRPIDDGNMGMTSPIGYTRALTEYIIDKTENSDIVKKQDDNKDINVLTGLRFAPNDDAEKIEDVKSYISSMGISDKANLASQLFLMSGAMTEEQIKACDENQLAAMLDQYMMSPDDNTLLAIYDNTISTGTYEENMKSFGVVGYDAPSSISIYTDTFENKDKISECIAKYNDGANEEDKITYTDYVGLLMSSVTTIIDVISYVLIAFVAVSLVVSSIMIGIITYISVLERTKEIGILRALGASKRNISQVFNSETFIIGLCSGLIGIGVTLLLLIPANIIIHKLTGEYNVNASLPVMGAVILVILSMLLTMLGGLIPSSKAAKQDPVTALRTE